MHLVLRLRAGTKLQELADRLWVASSGTLDAALRLVGTTHQNVIEFARQPQNKMSRKDVSVALKAVFKAKDRAAHSSVEDPSLNTDFEDAQAGRIFFGSASSSTTQRDVLAQENSASPRTPKKQATSVPGLSLSALNLSPRTLDALQNRKTGQRTLPQKRHQNASSSYFDATDALAAFYAAPTALFNVASPSFGGGSSASSTPISAPPKAAPAPATRPSSTSAQARQIEINTQMKQYAFANTH